MSPDEFRDARAALGHAWGLNRPLHMSELGRALRLQGRDPGESVRAWERGKTPISGPVHVAMLAMLSGYRPPWLADALNGPPDDPVAIYSFQVWDQAAGDHVTQPVKSSAERIARIGGEIISGSEEIVSRSALDADGRFKPR